MIHNASLSSKAYPERLFSHGIPNNQNLSILERKTCIIVLSVLVGIFTLGIGGILLFYSLSAKYKVEKIKQFESTPAKKTHSLVSKKTERSLLPVGPLSHICGYLSPSDLNSLARVDKNTGAIANDQLIMREANNLGWNSGRDEAHLDIQSANQYLSELFTAVKLLGEHYTLPDNVCVYRRIPSTIPFFFTSELQGRETAHNLKKLDTSQLSRLLVIASIRGDADSVKLLLQQGANPNLENDYNLPLHWAADKRHGKIVRLLLDNGAEVNAANKKGTSALHFAVRSESTDIVRDLLKKSANPNQENPVGETPLHWAASKGHCGIVALLLDNGADINAMTTSKHMSVLHFAVRSNHPDIVRYLLNQNACPNQRSINDYTPKDFARIKGNPEIIELFS